MTRNTALDMKMLAAEREHRCYDCADHAENRTMHQRMRAGKVVKLYCGLFLRAEYARTLDPVERTLHVIRALQHRHRNWVFACISAAVAYGFEVPYHTLLLSVIYIVSRLRSPETNSKHLYCLKSPDFEIRKIEGLRVTTPARTVVDCCCLLDTREARAVVDSALRKGVTEEEIRREAKRFPYQEADVLRALATANPQCENGGESYADCTIKECGFVSPRVQVEHVHPDTGQLMRDDFEWTDEDGTLIVGELDGKEKYTDSEMTHGKTFQEVLDAERIRQRGFELLGARVVRFTYDEVRERDPLVKKLREAGVPRAAPARKPFP